MQGFCPHCEKEREITFTDQMTTTTIEGYTIEFRERFWTCNTCHETWEDMDPAYDPMAEIFEKLRLLKEQKEGKDGTDKSVNQAGGVPPVPGSA